MIDSAKKAYDESNLEGFRKRVTEVAELVDLSYKSLLDSGKRARNKPKFWKRAELEIRTLMRRLDSFASYVGAEERDVVTSAGKHISDVHDQVLHEIMGPK